MIKNAMPAPSHHSGSKHASPIGEGTTQALMTEERLPFSVRLVRNEEDLTKAIDIRRVAYARHMPAVASTMTHPEAADTEDGVAVLLAASKLDGSPLGSVRIQSNRYRPLSLEQSITLPLTLKDLPLAQVSRLGIAQGMVGRLVKLVLVKASFQYCEDQEIDWSLVAARSPLDRQYQQLMFEALFPGSGFIPLPHMDNIPHRMMGFEIETGQARWTQAQHPMLKFFCLTHHPDIDVSLNLPSYKGQFAKSNNSWAHAGLR